MSLIKIKKIKVIYNLKIRIRNIKYLFKDTLYLILNGSELSKIIDYIKNHFKIRRIQFNRDIFYKGKTFNHGDWFSHKIPLLINLPKLSIVTLILINNVFKFSIHFVKLS